MSSLNISANKDTFTLTPEGWQDFYVNGQQVGPGAQSAKGTVTFSGNIRPGSAARPVEAMAFVSGSTGEMWLAVITFQNPQIPAGSCNIAGTLVYGKVADMASALAPVCQVSVTVATAGSPALPFSANQLTGTFSATS